MTTLAHNDEIDRLYESAVKYEQLSAGNVRVSVLSSPGEHGTHLIFCHAAGRLKEIYLKHVGLLRERGFKVRNFMFLWLMREGSITMCDARGHGDTPVGEEMNLDWWMHGMDSFGYTP
jgi:hypothetical protein